MPTNKDLNRVTPDTTSFDWQVALVSDQAAANLIPALDEELKPRKVLLVQSDLMRDRADALAAVLRKRGVPSERLAVADPYDLDLLTKEFLVWLEAHQDETITLNVTGGTKPMALASMAAFEMMGWAEQRLYLNHENGKLSFLGGQRAARPANTKLTIAEYLSAYGVTLEPVACKPSLTLAQRQACDKMIDNVAIWGTAVGLVNDLAARAFASAKLEVEVDPSFAIPPLFEDLVDELDRAKVMRRTVGGYAFADDLARAFANGAWLEYYAYALAAEIGADEIVANAEIRHPSGSKNEVDLLLMFGNRLFVIECKTSNLARVRADGDVGAAGAMYKVNSILPIGGLNTRGMLISYRELSPADRTRAKDLGLTVVKGDQLKTLRAQIEGWIKR